MVLCSYGLVSVSEVKRNGGRTGGSRGPAPVAQAGGAAEVGSPMAWARCRVSRTIPRSETPFGSFVWCRITVFPQTNSMSSGTACIRPSWYHWQRESRPAKVARDGCSRTPGCTLDSFRSLPSLQFATPSSRQSGRKPAAPPPIWARGTTCPRRSVCSCALAKSISLRRTATSTTLASLTKLGRRPRSQMDSLGCLRRATTIAESVSQLVRWPQSQG